MKHGYVPPSEGVSVSVSRFGAVNGLLCVYYSGYRLGTALRALGSPWDALWGQRRRLRTSQNPRSETSSENLKPTWVGAVSFKANPTTDSNFVHHHHHHHHHHLSSFFSVSHRHQPAPRVELLTPWAARQSSGRLSSVSAEQLSTRQSARGLVPHRCAHFSRALTANRPWLPNVRRCHFVSPC